MSKRGQLKHAPAHMPHTLPRGAFDKFQNVRVCRQTGCQAHLEVQEAQYQSISSLTD